METIIAIINSEQHQIKFIEQLDTTVHELAVHESATGLASDLRSTARRFNSQLAHGCITTLGKLFTPLCNIIVTKQYDLVPVNRW